MTKEERHLWYDFLSEHPVRFLRQKVIDYYIVDFYCHKARLVVELDGSQHFDGDARRKDTQRTQLLESRGLKVVRIPNNAVNENFRGVCEYIDRIVRERIPPAR
jgi:very-short-patch-repair endonuclease